MEGVFLRNLILSYLKYLLHSPCGLPAKEHYYGENKAGINNLMGIYSCITGKSYDEIEKEFEGRGYGDFKTAVGEAVVKELEPIQARYNELIKDKAYLEKCYSEAAPRAEAIARRTLQKVMKKVGYLPVAH